MNKEKMKSAYIKHIESMNEGELVELALGKGIFMDCDANDYSFYMSVLGSKDKHSNYHDGACICVGTATDTCGISDWPVTEAMEERYYDGDTAVLSEISLAAKAVILKFVDEDIEDAIIRSEELLETF